MNSVYDMARGYEIAFSYRDVPAEVDALVRMAGAMPARVLELAAGPAEHAIEFARRGADATALDLSDAMTARAAGNAAAAGVTITAVRGDMRDFSVAYPVDLAFCMISSISHVLTLDDLIAHFECVRRSLAPDGCYIVEASHPTDYLGAKSVLSEWDTTVGETSVHLAWGADGDVIDPVTQVTPLHVTLTMSDAGGPPESAAMLEHDRFWTRDEFDAAARLAGLRIEACYGDFGGKAVTEAGAWRMILILRPSRVVALDDGRTRLRAWTEQDADWYARIASQDELIQRFTTESATLTGDEVRAAIRGLATRDDAAGFLICDSTTGERLGNIALSYAGGVGEVSYWLAAAARGRGAATSALRQLSGWAFDPLGLDELRLHTHVDNRGSQRVAERAGYQRDPERDGTKHVRGETWDTVAYRRLGRNFKALP